MPVIGNAALAAAGARSTFEALAESALAGARATGVWSGFARKYSPSGSINHTITMPGATPTWKEWTDERDSGGFRKMVKTIPLKKFEKSIYLDRTDVVYDTDGSTAVALQQFVGRDVEAIYDKLVLDALKSNNTLGIDGSSLVSDTHPFGASGVWDNKTTGALSFAEFKAAKAFGRSLLDEFGEPLNIEYRILLVHPDEEQLALEIAQADSRPVAVATAGTYPTGVVGATNITNIFRGTVDVVVTPRWTSGDWLLVDPRYLPIALVEWRGPTTVIVDDNEADIRFREDKFFYGVEADIVADGLQPWGVFGKIT